MRAFLSDYDPRIQGVMPAEADLAPLLARFGVSAARLPPEIRRYVGRTVDPSRDYALEHTPTLWVVDSLGRLRGRFDASSSVEDIVAGIRKLIREGSSERSGA